MDVLNSTCPQCETVCLEPSCPSMAGNYSIQCEQTICNWDCVIPDTCPPKICHKQAEQVACMYSGAGSMALSLLFAVSILALTL